MVTCRRFFAALAALSPLCFVSCDSKTEHEAVEAIEQTYKIDPLGSLSIRNGSGSIAIYGKATPDVQLHAVKKANGPERLQAIQVSVANQPDFVSITTNFFQPKKQAFFVNSGTVEYTVGVLPTVKLRRVDLENGKMLVDGMRGGETHLSVVDGQLAVRNCFGHVDAAIANGEFELAYDQFEHMQFSVDAQVTNGNVRVFLPRNASFHLHAETASGRVSSELSETLELNGKALRKIDLALGKEARSEIKIRVTSGNIHIAEASAGIPNNLEPAAGIGSSK
jgi:DUF4097 and DUF4098 domain-containing protein YvlB